VLTEARPVTGKFVLSETGANVDVSRDVLVFVLGPTITWVWRLILNELALVMIGD
jgi:hypothetical protein